MYPEQQRKIFQYFDGQRQVYGDPLKIRRRLNGRLDGNLNKALADKDLSPEHYERVLDAVVYAFDLPPFNQETGEGAVEEVVVKALTSFLDWLQKKSPRRENSLTSVPPTDSSLAKACPIPTTVGSS